MSKEWYEESSEEFAKGFTEERQVHHRHPQEQDLAKTYGPMARHSEHKRGEHIKYLRADGMASSGVIEWIQASYEDVPIKYIIAPDDGGFLDFALPSDVITQDEQEP